MQTERANLAMLTAAMVLAALAPACKKAKPPTPPPPTVRVVPVESRNVEQAEDFLATLDGSTNAEIRPQVTGILESVAYQEGTLVRIGQMMFSIDKRPFVAAVTRAEGAHQNAVAQYEKARADVRRFTPLVREHAMSQQDLENARAAERQGAANVKTARGALEAAKLDLQWTEVRSPIHGLAGIAQTRVGNLVNPGQVLTIVSTLDPVRVSINISEREYLRYAHAPNDAGVSPFANLSRFTLILGDGTIYPYAVNDFIVSRGINPTTGTLTVQMLFPNPERLLRPGMFARVRAHSGTAPALVIPERSIQELQGRYQVRVVDAGNRVAVRAVTLGALIDHEYVVTSGLQAGERVVVEGLQNAEPGALVTVQTESPRGSPAGAPIGGSGAAARPPSSER